MAWCENPNCKKTGLSKWDVEFDEGTKRVLCQGCYCLAHPGWMPEQQTDYVVRPPMFEPVDELPKLNYEISFTSENGFVAKIGMGDMGIGFHAPMAEIQKFFAGKPSTIDG